MDEDPVFMCKQMADLHLTIADLIGGVIFNAFFVACHSLYIQEMVHILCRISRKTQIILCFSC